MNAFWRKYELRGNFTTQFVNCERLSHCTLPLALKVNIFYNIARVLALYKSYWAAMNKIFIYARLCVNKDFFMMTCWAVFFVSFPKCPKINGNDEKVSRFCLEFSLVLATQTNSKSGEDVSQILEPEWFVQKSAVKQKLCTFVIAEQSDWSRKIYLTITRQITQKDINLLLTNATADRSSQEAVMTSYCS